MVTIKINPAYLAANFGNLTPDEQNQIVFPLEDISLNGSNTPIVPSARNATMINGFQKVTFQQRTRSLFVTVNGVQLEEQMMKMASAYMAVSSVGGSMPNNLAQAIAEGSLIAFKSTGAPLTYDDILTANY